MHSNKINFRVWQHVAHARLATLARALPLSLTHTQAGLCSPAYRLHACAAASLSRALSLPLSRAVAAAAPSADLSRRSLPRRLAAAAAPFVRPVHIFISAHSDVDVSDASAHCIRLPYSPRVLFVGVQVHFRCVSINEEWEFNWKYFRQHWLRKCSTFSLPN